MSPKVSGNPPQGRAKTRVRILAHQLRLETDQRALDLP